MNMAPWVFEAVVAVLIGLSGVGFGILVGWRHPLLLAATAILAAASMLVLTALGVWSIGLFGWLVESWWVLSVTVAIAGGVAGFRHARRLYLQSLGLFATFSAVSIAIKYVLQIGERHHRDSSGHFTTALLIFQKELDPAQWGAGEKGGLAYPLLLALGPESRILSFVTPLIFLSLLALSWWLAREILRDHVPVHWQVTAGVLVAAFSVTVPIFRVALTYLNSHTLMALALLAMLVSYVIAEQDGAFTLATGSMMVMGSLVGTTARAEGILFVATVLVLCVSGRSLSTAPARVWGLAAIAVSGGSFAAWLHLIDSEAPGHFGVQLWAVAAGVIVTAFIVVSPFLDKVRWLFFPLAVVVISVPIIRVAIAADNPISPFMAQFNNVVRGYGGWGVAALALAASLVLLGWRARSVQYRKLATLLVVLIFATLLAKLFDGGGFGGGFGRDGFYDSVNRMWLHTLGITMVTTVVGYAEFFRDFAKRRSTSPSVRHPDGYTSSTVSKSKDSQS